ncbi:hypothetical protein P9279_22180 [Mesorhizobium sp. WSM4962]|uniref:hypothetical protein n=1 Tax=Mesorhizobium sp. WSM4962 TaxID=3038548 RepID=UPI00241613CA|nr:hypothetical protein [Mesorhizobium sp. WSM4962]MDG4903222.1 hypothetical protein [Mesorhizobium sp. WSM4962]
MPSPFGSLANPVQQDPFQTIIKVHWKDKKNILAVAFVVRLGAVVAGDQASPIYYSPFGNPNVGVYHPTVFVPKTWGAYLFDETEGWIGAASFAINGLPEFGPAPNYQIGGGVTVDVFPYALSLHWVEPTGGDLGFTTPPGEGTPRAFRSGTASITNFDGTVTSMDFPTGITVEAGAQNYAYAGAAVVPRVVSQDLNVLVDNRELIILCLPVTA